MVKSVYRISRPTSLKSASTVGAAVLGKRDEGKMLLVLGRHGDRRPGKIPRLCAEKADFSEVGLLYAQKLWRLGE